MVFAKLVDEEGVENLAVAEVAGIDRVDEVGIVDDHHGGLLGEDGTLVVDDVEQARVGEILDIVHHRGAAGVDSLCELADVGRLACLQSQQVVELLDFREIFELYLADQQHIDLDHHVHRLEQVLRVVGVLQEEGVETVVEILLEE